MAGVWRQRERASLMLAKSWRRRQQHAAGVRTDFLTSASSVVRGAHYL